MPWLPVLALALVVFGCGPATTPAASEPVAVGDPNESIAAAAGSTIQEPAAPLPPIGRELSAQHDQVYELARLGRYLFVGSQGGASVIDVPTGTRVAAHDEFICNAVAVVAEAVWSGCDRHVLRWSPQHGWRAYLPNADDDAEYYDLLVDAQGELQAAYGPDQWRYDPVADRFEPMPPTFAGSYHAVVHRGELWTIDFMRALHRQGAPIALGAAVYPARDPRRFTIDAAERLYVEDFGAGLLRFDGQAFQPVPGLGEKGTGVAYDAPRDRLWLLHYTDGLTITEAGRVVQRVDLSDLGYMRKLLLEPDGSVWVGGWPGLARVRWDGGDPVREDLF